MASIFPSTLLDAFKKLFTSFRLEDKHKLEEEVKILFGNSIKQGPTEILNNIIKRIHIYNQESKLNLQNWRFFYEYQDLHQRLSDIHVKLDKFIQDPTNDQIQKWSEFSEPYNIDWFYKWITIETITSTVLTEDLSAICNMDHEMFKMWQTEICALFAETFIFQTVYLYFQLKSTTHNFQTISNKEIPEQVQKQLKTMTDQSRNVADAMDRICRQLKAKFLFKKKGDISELLSNVYHFLEEKYASENQVIAQLIATHFRTIYPYFLWSVIVVDTVDGCENIELQLNTKNLNQFWLQRFGKQFLSSSQEPIIENVIMFNSLNGYGYVLCYRITQTSKKAALIFWIDKENVQSKEMAASYSRLRMKLEDEQFQTSFNCKKHEGSATRLTSQMEGIGIKYIIGVGVFTDSNSIPNIFSIGIDLEEESQKIGKKEERYSVPMCITNTTKSNCVVIFPEPSTDSPKCEFAEEKLEIISSELGGYVVCKSLLINMEIVAVKEVILEVRQEDRDRQISKLDFGFKFLMKFSHPNVIRYIGYQPSSLSSNLTSIPKYKIIMEYYEGGSLTDAVRRNVATIEQIRKWGAEILRGLVFLHEHGVAHKALHGDHIMFEGPAKAAGNIKIISLGRINDIIPRVNRSYVPEHRTSLPEQFRPPEMNSKVGSKTDIWSFGCVLIQMITGKVPELEKSASGINRPTIPKTSEELVKVIELCLDIVYEKRPMASELLSSEFFIQSKSL